MPFFEPTGTAMIIRVGTCLRTASTAARVVVALADFDQECRVDE